MRVRQEQVHEIYMALLQLGRFGLPCGYALSKNTKRLKKHNEKLIGSLDELVDKYCTLAPESPSKYQLKDGIDSKRGPVSYKDYWAGDKQDEYESKIDKIEAKEVEVDFYQIDMSREVTEGGKTMTLGDKIDTKYDIPSGLITPLLDYIFIEGETSK